MAKTFKSTEVVAEKNSTIWQKSNNHPRTKIYACTDATQAPEYITAGSQPPTMQQDKWANLGTGPPTDSKKSRLLSSPRTTLEHVHHCVCVCVSIHAWLVSMRKQESVGAVQCLPPPIMEASGPITLPISLSCQARKQERTKGQMHQCWSTSLRRSSAPSDLSFTFCFPRLPLFRQAVCRGAVGFKPAKRRQIMRRV